MAIKKILSVQDPRLREVSKPVEKIDKKLARLLQDLKDTLVIQKNPPGVGLAGPQIGEFVRVFVIKHKGKTIPIVNPEITQVSKQTNDPLSREASGGQAHSDDEEAEYIMEGCLSLPHYYGPVKRAHSIEIKYTKPDGQTKVEKFTGFPAQIIQHEIDHLNGKIFVDRLIEQRRQLFRLHKGHWHEMELP